MPMKNVVLEQVKNEASHSLAQLQAALGKVEPGLDEAFFHGVAEGELVSWGQRIGTPKILSDARRLYPMAFDFWVHANEAQRGRLVGFSQELLGIAVAHALALQGLLERHTDRSEAVDASRDGREREAREAFGVAVLLRDQAISTLRTVVAGNRELGDAVSSAVGTADTPENLAKAVKKLAAVGTRVLAEKKGPLAQRAKLFRLDAAYVEELAAAGDRLAAAAEGSRARSGAKRVTQSALDLEDGKNLRLLSHLIDAFEAAHDIDPTIPRLVPIATRGLLRRARKEAEKAAPEQAPSDEKGIKPS